MYLPHRKIAGFSLLEVVIATAVFIMTIVGIYGVYSMSLRSLLAADGSAVSSENLLQRLEQLRRTGWANATSPVYISSLLSTPIASTAQNLPNIVEEHITVSAASLPYASPAPSPLPVPAATPAPFTVTRRGSSVTVSPATPGTMSGLSTVNILVSLTWMDHTKQQHTREFSTVISKAAFIH